LRVLQERTIERLGSNTERQVNLRIVTATKVDLNKLAAEGRFREDLAYRLDIARVEIPPLRQRGRDIVLLFSHFLDLAARRQGRATPVADAGTIEQLMAHDWPGNVRELRNAAERFVLGMGLPNPAQPAAAAGDPDDLLEQTLNRAERAIIIDALASHEGRMGETAEALGISRKTLYLKMRKLEIAARPEDEAG
jgi:two-component system C4-dicarboxylate transport response regulator DctD